MKPSIGRIVHFVQNNVHYPALILKVWSDTCVTLRVFHNGNDKPVPGALNADEIAFSVPFAEPCAHCGRPDWSWHWPEHVE
ncbi:MAG TPA: hypothetical protein VE714_12640 [Gemmatimonadales bacterium]|jgi:hypothetical protein|nr:hypothetical protein [Gemmatimonadales bacterium]